MSALLRGVSFGHLTPLRGLRCGVVEDPLRVACRGLAPARRLLVGLVEDLVGLHAGVVGALAAFHPVGGALDPFALLGQLHLDLRDPIQQVGDDLRAR